MKRLLVLFGLLPLAAWAEIVYTLKPEVPEGRVRIEISLPDPGASPEFRIPRWCPGFYRLLPYHEKIDNVSARAGEQTLTVTRKDDSGWVVENPSKEPFTFSYTVKGDDPGLGFFGVNVRSHAAFVNGPAAFMYVEGRLRERTRLKIERHELWNVATAMDPDPTKRFEYVAGDYDELIDHPIQLGEFEYRSFTVGKARFEVVYVSIDKTFKPDLNRLTRQLEAVTRPQMELFGKASFTRYVYIVHLAIGDFGGGLEHRASTVLAMPNTANLSLAHLASHELFHAWNVKQIRPQVLGPFDYTQPNRTGLLWFAEGVTDYYAHVMVYRGGESNALNLLDALGDNIRSLQRSGMRLRETIENVSRATWEHGGFGMGDLNYYTKGLVMGLIFDAAIRDATNGLRSLDDVMRLLYARHALPRPGMSEDGVKLAINEVAGKDLSALYDRLARSTEEMPYELLGRIGLRVRKPNDSVPDLGFVELAGRVRLITPAAQAAGLSVGAQILTVNGKPYAHGIFQGLTGQVRLTVRQRDGQRRDVVLAVTRSPSTRWSLELDLFAGPREAKLREGWLARSIPDEIEPPDRDDDNQPPTR